MLPVEFFYTSNDQFLPLDEEGNYIWRQYTRGTWYVRVSDATIRSVFIKIAEEEFPLERYLSDDCYTLSKNVAEQMVASIERRSGNQGPTGWVGLLNLWFSDSKNRSQRLEPSLFIEPSYLNGNDFKALIERLQDLASFPYSPTQIKRKERGGSTEGGTDDDEDELLKQAASKLLNLSEQIYSDWPLVQATASRETRLLPKLVDVSSAAASSSSRIAAKRAQHPHARRAEILMPQETFATAENRFLVYALQEIYQRSPVFERRLKARSNELQARWKTDDNHVNSKRLTNQQKKEEADLEKVESEMAHCLTGLAQGIVSDAKKIALYVNDHFLQEVRDDPALPSRPTDRLTRSLAYGSIYAAFYDYQNQPGISFVPLKPGLMQALNSKPIHPACTLYELWVFVEIYDMLIHTFGFRLPVGAKVGHPLEYADGVADEVVGDALKGKEFCLELRPTNKQERQIAISLWYDTEESKRRPGASQLRPDIYLEVTDSNTGRRYSFAIDAKYHSYPGYYMREEREKHGVSTVFDLDLLVTAKEKYYKKLGCNAAFVVHSDSNINYTYWGGNLYKPGDDWPDHRYGAVFAKPSDTSNLRKLLKCFLMYHVGIEDICWLCRSEIYPKTTSERSERVYDAEHNYYERQTVQKPLRGSKYECLICQQSWMRQWCSGKGKHKLLKIGADTFHVPAAIGSQVGDVACPSCSNGHPNKNKTFGGTIDERTL